jgi:hypothetical protein
MPIVKEKRQFQIKPIGVVAQQANTATANAIVRGANEISDLAFQDMVRIAKERGLDAGAAAKVANIKAIDPVTGVPVALATPKGFGTAAQVAYERVVDDRFRQSIDEDIKLKARELGLKYQNHPNSVELYKQAMGDYVESMSKHADPNQWYHTYIMESGTALVASTSLALEQRRTARRAAGAGATAKKEREAAGDAVYNSYLSQGMIADQRVSGHADEISDTPPVIRGLIESSQKQEAAGLVPAGTTAAYSQGLLIARTRGIIANKLPELSPAERLMASSYIGSGGQGVMPDAAVDIVEALSVNLHDPDAVEDIGKFSATMVRNMNQNDAAVSAIAAAEMNAVILAGSTRANAANLESGAVSFGTPEGNGESVISTYANLVEDVAPTLASLNKDEASTAKRFQEVGANIAMSWLDGALSAASDEIGADIGSKGALDQINNAISSRNPGSAPEKYRDLVEAVLGFDEVGLAGSDRARAHFNSTVAAVRSEGEVKRKALLTDTVPKMNEFSTDIEALRGAEATKVRDMALSLIPDGIGPESVLALTAQINLSYSKSILTGALEELTSDPDLVSAYINGGKGKRKLTGLTVSAMERIDAAQAASPNQEEALTRHVAAMKTTIVQGRQERAAAEEFSILTSALENGRRIDATGTNAPKVQAAMRSLLQLQMPVDATGNKVPIPSDFFSNDIYTSAQLYPNDTTGRTYAEVFSRAHDSLIKMSITALPEEMVNQINLVAEGRAGSAGAFLRSVELWDRLHSQPTALGNTVLVNMEGIEPAQAAVMDTASAILQLTGTNRNALDDAQGYVELTAGNFGVETDRRLLAKLESESYAAFVAESLGDNVSLEASLMMTAYLKGFSVHGLVSKKDITKMLRGTYKRTWKEGAWPVVSSRGAAGTRFTLEAVTGSAAQDFGDYTAELVAKIYDAPVSFGASNSNAGGGDTPFKVRSFFDVVDSGPELGVINIALVPLGAGGDGVAQEYMVVKQSLNGISQLSPPMTIRTDDPDFTAFKKKRLSVKRGDAVAESDLNDFTSDFEAVGKMIESSILAEYPNGQQIPAPLLGVRSMLNGIDNEDYSEDRGRNFLVGFKQLTEEAGVNLEDYFASQADYDSFIERFGKYMGASDGG